MDEAKRKQREAEMNEIYLALGKFVVAFERLCDTLQTSVVFLLDSQGLKNQRVSTIVLAGMTASPLLDIYRPLIGELYKLEKDDQKVVDQACKRFRELIEQRNDVIHASWYVGFGNGQTTDWSTALTRKLHKNKEGAVYKQFERTAAGVMELVHEAAALIDLFNRIFCCLTAGSKGLSGNFIVDSNDKFAVPKPITLF